MTVIRHMTQADLETVLAWAAAEGWNPGHDDAAAFLAADPHGFFLSEVDGEPAAAISVVNHGPHFAFLGLYICHPSHRGRGIGYALWKHALEHAGERTVGLDGVAAQQENYEKSGFANAGSTVRYSGVVSPADDVKIRMARPVDLPYLIALEAASSGWEKTAYLSAWFGETRYRKTFVLESRKAIEGFVTVRQCGTGAKIGPLIATGCEGAERLIRYAAGIFEPTLTIDVPVASATLDDLCRGLGLDSSFSTARMYRGPAQSGNPSVYAVTSLELG